MFFPLTMKECQNFFDDKSPSICKSSSSGEHQQLSPSSTTVEGNVGAEGRHLELQLGPSEGAIRPNHHETVRPIPRYPSLDRQQSENYGNIAGSSSLFRGRSDSFTGEKAFFSKYSAFSTPPLVSPDQAWLSVKNSSAICGSGSPTASGGDSASGLHCRRSASMQLLTPSNEMSDAVACPAIHRSCSNLMSAGLLSRGSSITEALIDESLDLANSTAHQHHLDTLELQEKKEIQARRRFEARKRRRLILEKQQKRARQGNVPNNRWSFSAVEKASLTRTYSLVQQRNYSLGCNSHFGITAAKLADGENKMSNIHVKDGENRMKSSVLQQGINEIRRSFNFVGKGHESVSPTSTGITGTISNVRQMIASCDLSADSGGKEGSPCQREDKDVEMFDVSKMVPSSCSEAESSGRSGKETYASEHESSSQKSSTESRTRHSTSVAFASPSKSKLCLQTAPGALPVHSKARIKSPEHRSLCFLQKSSENESRRTPKAPCNKVLDPLDKLPSKFTIKKSVGVFYEGKWRIPDDDLNYLPIRRTASNISEAVPEQLCMEKKREMFASLSASQLKFAARVVNNRLSPSQGKVQLCLPSKSHTVQKVMKQEAEAGLVDNVRSHHIPTFKVKEEPDMMDGAIISECHTTMNPPRLAALKMGSEPVQRQTDASLSALPSVTTRGIGPNGRTINGVLYIIGGRSVHIVCRCHGTHMTPAEFVEHAGSTDLSNPLRNIVVNSFPLANHSASTYL